MSDDSLPETLDGAAAPTAARTRQEDMATTTIIGHFSDSNRRHLEKVDLIQSTVDFIKIRPLGPDLRNSSFTAQALQLLGVLLVALNHTA